MSRRIKGSRYTTIPTPIKIREVIPDPLHAHLLYLRKIKGRKNVKQKNDMQNSQQQIQKHRQHKTLPKKLLYKI